ncbi:MAG: hypothetical protein ABW321_10260 [Polyangiales bacterium]
MMTSEDTSQAITLRELQLDELGRHFFERGAREASEADASEWLPACPPSRTERRAMRATFAMLAASGIGWIVFMIYSHVIMPTPVDLARGTKPAPAIEAEAAAENAAERPD